jgi:hypothetical protein
MSEALTAALLLPIVAILLDPPKRLAAAAGLGLAIAVLFLVRPNAGAAVVILAPAALWLSGGRRTILALLAGFAALWLPFWALTRVSGDPFRGMSPAFISGSVDYSWIPGHETAREEPPPFVQVRTAIASWKATLGEKGADLFRQLAWRALHGALGTEFYDARWSPAYARLSTLSRLAAPLLILAALAALLTAPLRAAATAKAHLLPLRPGGAEPRSRQALRASHFPCCRRSCLRDRRAPLQTKGAGRRIAAAAVSACSWRARGSARSSTGNGASSKLRCGIIQTIPRGALPLRAPATLHIRIAPPLLPSGAGLEVSDPAAGSYSRPAATSARVAR